MRQIQVEEGIGNCLLTAVVLSCASPAVTLNVWPRIEQLLSPGGMTSNQIGIILLVTLSALGMTCVPFAMKKAENYGFWLTCLAFGIGLGILNYTMAVGAVGKTRDDEAGAKRTLIEKASSLKETIASTQRLRESLPTFRWTTQAMVDSAALAVRLTDDARRKECEKIGDYCRALVAQLSNRQAEFADITSHQSNTDRAIGLDESLHRLRLELSGLGSIPTSSDQQAGRIARFLAGIGFLKGKPADEIENVADWIVQLLALCAEAFALGMPRIIVTALARKPNGTPLREKKIQELPITPPNSNSTIQTIPMDRRSKASSRPEASVQEWKQLSMIRATGKLRDWAAYESYKAFSKEKGLAPASFPKFSRELQDLGIKLETDAAQQRDFFLEVAIRQPLKAVS